MTNPRLFRRGLFLEAPPRIELGMKVLQTSALPLGYGAEYSKRQEKLLPFGVWSG